MLSRHALRRQVQSEVRMRRYMINAAIALCLVYLVGTLVFSDMGFVRYMELSKKQTELQQELDTISEQNRLLAETLKSYETDPFYIEKHAREEFGMAGPGETIFIFKK